MSGLDEKVQDVYEEVLQRNVGETEFHQAVHEVLDSLGPVIAKHPQYADAAIIRRKTPGGPSPARAPPPAPAD